MAGVPRHHRGRQRPGVVHLFPTPAALAAFCRTHTDHDLADHPVWPVVAGLGAADLTPDDDHRYDLDGVYDIAAENPDRWAVEELAATIDIVSRLAECLDTSDEDDDEDAGRRRGARASSRRSPSWWPGRRSARSAWASRPSSAAPARTPGSAVGGALDELWEDVVEELGEHLDWTGAGTASLADYPSAAEEDDEDPTSWRTRARRLGDVEDDRRRGGPRGGGRAAAGRGDRGGRPRPAAAPAPSAAAAGSPRPRPRSPPPPSSGRRSASCPWRSSSPRARA